ncbi:MAG: hypothetical protein ACYC99_18105, partial [Candidatus Geothermincolia bacterium]
MLNTLRTPKVMLASLLVISCAMLLATPALGSGADIWSAVSTGGFGTNLNSSTYCLTTHGGFLYAGTGNTSTGCEIWRYDGASWQRVVGRGGAGTTAPGFGDPRNTAVNSMVSWHGYLWVGTNNNPNASPPGTGAEMWRFDGSTWAQANLDGFDDPLHNGTVSSIVAFGSYLYAGVYNQNDGCRVYRTLGTGALPLADWSQTNNDGFDLDWTNQDVSALTVFGGYILAGTYNSATGCEVWRSDDGHTWFQANTDGFGTASNEEITAFAALGTYLYAGIANLSGPAAAGCKVFRASVGSGLPFSDWTQVNTSGFGDSHNTGAQSLFSDGAHLFVGTYNTLTGGEIWRTAAAGSAPYGDWVQSNDDGFGNGDNDEAVWSLAQYNTFLYAGTVNILQGTRVMRGNLPGRTWYLPEGSTAWGYDAYISIENPNSLAKTARVTYMTQSGAVPGGDFALPPNSQTTINPRSLLGDQDFSTRVDSLDGSTLAVDRTMTWTGTGAVSPEAHSSVGVTAPSTKWYLPEGSSNWGFECFLLIQNPNPGEASCDVTYMIEGESPMTVNHRVPANSRATFTMSSDIGAKDASIQVESSVPVIPERSMYRNNRREGHDSIGTTAPANNYYLAEGTIGWGFTSFVLVQNPHASPPDVTLTYMTASGSR